MDWRKSFRVRISVGFLNCQIKLDKKAIITLKTNGQKASDIKASINQWLSQVPSQLFKSITFDCGKEFSNWKSISYFPNSYRLYFNQFDCSLGLYGSLLPLSLSNRNKSILFIEDFQTNGLMSFSVWFIVTNILIKSD